MTTSWVSKTLGQIAQFRNGKSVKPGGLGQYPVYGSNGTIGASDEYMYERAIVLGRVGAYCGSVELCPGKFWASDNTIVVEEKPEEVNLLFLYHLLVDADLHRHAGGAAQPLLTQTALKPLEFLLPPLPTQRRIASVLSTYDDLIENNTRRIAILEEMPRRLYEEWFVQFRFPGHEGAEFERELPKGWKLAPLANLVCYINRGIPPKYDENAEGMVINQKCVRDQRLNLEPARRQSKPVPAEKLLRFGDILINSTGVGTLGRVAQVLEPLESCTTDSHVTIVRANPQTDPDFLGLTLFRLQPHFEDQGVGSTGQTELSRGRIAETECVVPPQPLQKLFGETVRPLRALCVKLLAKNANLRAQRDLLLPKLISGEIDVSNLPLPGTEDQAA